MEGRKDFWMRLDALDSMKELNNMLKLGRDLGIDTRTLWQTKQRESYPQLDRAVALAKHFNTTVEYLVTGEEERGEGLKPSLGYLTDALNNADEEQLSAIRLILGIKKSSVAQVG